jgi:hypothetical protein
MTTKSGEKPGYRAQGKARSANKKNNFAINPEQMEYERRKLLEQMSSKMSPNKKQLNTMAAVAATKEPEYFDEEGNKKEPTMRILSLGAGVQSSCLALMAQEGLTKHKPDYMIFADTGWEPDVCQIHLCLLLVLVERLVCYIANAPMTIR